MKPTKTLVVDATHLKGFSHYPERYPDATVVKAGTEVPATISPEDVSEFLEGLDVVFCCETPYSPLVYHQAKLRGIATVCQYNFEFLDQNHQPPTLLAAPTMWHFDDVIHPRKKLLPVPIATDRWIRPDLTHRGVERATRFVHVVGRPAYFDRNGTPDFLTALEKVTEPILVTLYCQSTDYLRQLLKCYEFPGHVTVVQGATKPNYWDLYLDQDVMVLPRRFGGLCLPAQEALGAGLPVIMPNISPNNDLLPDEWLVPATECGSLGANGIVKAYRADPVALADVINRLASDTDFYRQSHLDAMVIAQRRSWSTLKPMYDDVLQDVVDQVRS